MAQNLLNVRILIPSLEISKMLQFDANIPISEVIQQIQSKVQNCIESHAKPEDYCLYRSDPDDENIGFWLNNQASLGDYSVKQGDQLLLKNIKKMLKYKLPDGSMKTVLVDESKLMSEVFKMICARSGINTVDEYSLAIEDTPEEPGTLGTGTIGKRETFSSGAVRKGGKSLGITLRKFEEREMKRMEKLKQKLHTDDEIRWIDHSRTLAEQGIGPSCILCLRRKYFFESNRNILDPMEVNILYNQCRDAILSGQLLCTLEEATTLAALQLQIQRGDFNEASFKSSTNTKEYLPKDHQKNLKSVEKKMKPEYEALVGVNEIDARQRYISFCQGLKMYGASIFLVKEKMPGKQKLGETLLGITKEKIMRLDEKTKEVLTAWPLTNVRRWASSPNSFTFDFGDYHPNYSIMTLESETISNLISGYIDLILKKRRHQAAATTETGVALVEESIQPGRGVVITTGGNAGATRPHGVAARSQLTERVKGAKGGASAASRLAARGVVSRVKVGQQKLAPPQKILVDKLAEFRKNLSEELNNVLSDQYILDLFAFNPSIDNNTFAHSQYVAAYTSSQANCFVRLLHDIQDKENIDFNSLSGNIVESRDCLLQLSKALNLYGKECSPSDQEKINQVIKDLFKNYQTLLSAFEIAEGKIKDVDMETFMRAFSNIPALSQAALNCVGAQRIPEEVTNALLSQSERLSSSVAKFLKEVETASSTFSNKDALNVVTEDVKTTRKKMSEISTSLLILAPLLYNEQNSELLVGLCHDLGRNINSLCKSCEEHAQSSNSSKLNACSSEVNAAIASLVKLTQEAGKRKESEGFLKDLLSQIVQGMEGISDEEVDAEKLRDTSKHLTLNLGRLLAFMKEGIGSAQDDELKNDLFLSAKALADATKSLLDNTKALQASTLTTSEFVDSQRGVMDNAFTVINKRYNKELNAVRLKVLKRHLEAAIASSIRLEPCMKNAVFSCRSEAIAQGLVGESDELEASTKMLINSLGNLNSDANSHYYREDLIERAKFHCSVSRRAINTAKNAVPLIADFDDSSLLNKGLMNLQGPIEELEKFLQKQGDASDSTKLNVATARLNEARKYLETLTKNFNEGKIPKYPEESKDAFNAKMTTIYREIMRGQAQLTDLSGHEAPSTICASLEGLSFSLYKLLHPMYGVAACCSEETAQKENFNKLAADLMSIIDSTIACCQATQDPLDKKGDNLTEELLKALKHNSDMILNLVSSLPSDANIESIDELIKTINDDFASKKPTPRLKPNQTIAHVQEKVSENVSSLLQTIAELLGIVSRDEAKEVPPALANFATDFKEFYNNIKLLRDNISDEETSAVISKVLGEAIQMVNRFASTAKLYVADPCSSTKIFITESSKNLSDVISNLLLTILASNPGRRECESFKNKMKLTYAMLLHSSDCAMFSQKAYDDCVKEIETCLNQEYPSVATRVLKGAENQESLLSIGNSVKDWGEMITKIVENTCHVAFLIGMSDSNSNSGSSAIFNEDELKSTLKDLAAAFDPILVSSGKLTQADTDDFSKRCQESSGRIIVSCKQAVNLLTGSSGVQKEILEAVNGITQRTKEAINSVKSLQGCPDKAECEKQIIAKKDALLNEAEGLLKLLNSSEMRLIPGTIGERGRLMQEPVVENGLNVLNNAVDTVDSIGSLIQNYDPELKTTLTQNLDSTSIAISHLLAQLKSRQPGEDILNEIIEALEKSDMAIEGALVEVLAKLQNRNIRALKELEKKFKLNYDKLENILGEVKATPSFLSHLRPARLEIGKELIQGLIEIIVGLSLNIGSVDKEVTSKLFEDLRSLTISLMHCANSLRLDPQSIRNKNPMDFDSSISLSLENCKKLHKAVRSLLPESGVAQSLLLKLEELNSMIEQPERLPSQKTGLSNQVDSENELKQSLKNVVKISYDLIQRISSKPELVEPRCKDLVVEHEKCALLQFNNVSENFLAPLKPELKQKYSDLSKHVECLLKSLLTPSEELSKADLKKALAKDYQGVCATVSDILKLIQSSHKGAEACSKLADHVADIVNDIDTCILFAQNDSLEREPDLPELKEAKNNVISSGEAIVNCLDKLVETEHWADSDLLNLASELNQHVDVFLNINKAVATSLGSKKADKQLLLLEATKEVGLSLADLLESLQGSQQSFKPPENQTVKEHTFQTKKLVLEHRDVFQKVQDGMLSSAATISGVISQLETMKPYLDSTQSCPWDDQLKDVAPEDLVRMSKEIPIACAKIVQALSSENSEELEEFVKKGLSSFKELFKGTRKLLLSPDGLKVYPSAKELEKCAESFVSLLKLSENNKNTPDKKKLNENAKQVTQAVVIFVKKCSELKAENFVDENDPNVMAERELLNAAAAIEQAAKKLSELKPRVVPSEAANQDLNFEGQILEAANSIMKATAHLMAAATSAQQELVKKGFFKPSANPQETGQWSHGLISAARTVANSTNMLCDAAKAAVEGKASEEKLIAACNSISSSTAQLIMACRVKADPNSENQARLEKAGFAVKRASKTLVESLKGSGVFEGEKNQEIVLESSKVGGMKQELDAMEEILRREKELQGAREKLFKLRNAKATKK